MNLSPTPASKPLHHMASESSPQDPGEDGCLLRGSVTHSYTQIEVKSNIVICNHWQMSICLGILYSLLGLYLLEIKGMKPRQPGQWTSAIKVSSMHLLPQIT